MLSDSHSAAALAVDLLYRGKGARDVLTVVVESPGSERKLAREIEVGCLTHASPPSV